MIWLLIKRLIRQFPKWALVITVLVVSTALFAFWWFTRGANSNSRLAPVEDIGPKLALVESKPERLLLVDNDLYDLDDGQVIFRNWLQSGMPLRLFYDSSSKKMIAQYERGFVRYALNGRAEATLAPANKAAFSADLKFAVYAKQKDVWRADIDWQAFKFIDERKLTSIEQFNELNFADNAILLTPDTLVVRNFNTLLRVDLDTGSVKPIRIPLGDIGKRRSPDSKWVVGAANGQFYCYDVAADQAKTIPIGRVPMTDFQWLGNDKCLCLAAGKAVVIYDRLDHSLTEVAALPFPCFKIGEPSPSGRFVFCAGGLNGREGALVDLDKKTANRVVGGAGIAWISSDTFGFSRDVPNTELRGTWLQTAGEAERRLSPEPYLVTDAGSQMITLPAARLVIFETRHALMKWKPNATDWVECIKVAHPPVRVLGIQQWD